MPGPLFARLAAARVCQHQSHALTADGRQRQKQGGNWHLRKSKVCGRARTSNTLLDSRPRRPRTCGRPVRRNDAPVGSDIAVPPSVPVSRLGPSAGFDSPAARKCSWWRVVSSARIGGLHRKNYETPPTARLRRCAADTRMDPFPADDMPITHTSLPLSASSSHRIDDNPLRDSVLCFATVSFD
jgi:hypothetical protein